MDLPASASISSVAILLGAIALVLAASALLERRHDRRTARSPHVDMQLDALIALTGARRDSTGVLTLAPERESNPRRVSADLVRRIVDPALPPSEETYPWRPAGGGVLPFDVLGYDGSMAWTKAESDGLVALFHLGTDLTALAEEMGLDERVLAEELARRVYGAVDPVVDPTRPRAGAPWSAADREAIERVVGCGACLSDTARQLGRDQLDVVLQLIHDGRRPLRADLVR
jgi:hypothetical protein